MDDGIIGLLFIIFILGFNTVKFVLERLAKGRQPPADPRQKPDRNAPSTLEDFFEEIERKFNPQPRELAEWPETIKRPDYVREMEEYETAQREPAPVFRDGGVVRTAPAMPEMPKRAAVEPPRSLGKVSTFKIPAQGAVFAGLGHMRISMPPMLRSATGRTDFDLNTKARLKQALIASLVFDQPRAYDVTFKNTLAK